MSWVRLAPEDADMRTPAVVGLAVLDILILVHLIVDMSR